MNPAPTLVAKQQELVRSATSIESLCSYLVQQLNIKPDLISLPPNIQAVTSDEMLNAPAEWDRYVGCQLLQVPRIEALSSPWWYICHIAWLERGVFPDPPDTTFNARINPRILESNPETIPNSASKKLDDATRNLLRRLGGLPHIRRLYRVAEDPPIPRAYWRCRIAADATASAPANSGLTFEKCHALLHSGQWGRFIERTQNAYSSLLSPRSLAAVCMIADSNKKGVRMDHLQVIARRCLQTHPDLADWAYLSRTVVPSSAKSKQTGKDSSTTKNRQARRTHKRNR